MCSREMLSPIKSRNWSRMGSTRIREVNRSPESFVYWVAAIWILFVLWNSSALPYTFQLGIFNSTEARSISLAFAVFLGLSCYPWAQRNRTRLARPWEIMWALLGAATAAYQFLFFESLANRPGVPTPLDLAAGTLGLIILVEAARRTIALPVAIVAIGCMGYALFGSGLGEKIWIVSFKKFLVHYWLTTEGVFGLPLGVVVSMVIMGVVLGSGLDRIKFGDRFIAWMFRPFSPNANNDGLAPIPRWLKGRTWTWVFTFQFLALTQFARLKEILSPLIELTILLTLLLLLNGGKRLVKIARERIGSNPEKSIWTFCDAAIITGLFLVVAASVKFPFTVGAVLFALPIVLFRRWREKADVAIAQTKPAGIKIEIETSAYAIVLVGLLSKSLIIVMASFGYLMEAGNIGAVQNRPSGTLIDGVIVLGVIVLLTVSSLRNSNRNFLPVALFLVIVAILANGLFVQRLSPGLSGYRAIIGGFALVAIAPFVNWTLHRSENLGKVAKTAVTDVIDWMSLGGRNAIPIVILAAAIGIAAGTISLTGTGSAILGFD